MPNSSAFPPLDDFAATRQTLQLYSRAVAAIPRAYAEPHPQWWHVSLTVKPDGLVTDTIALPDGGEIALKLDLKQHNILLFTEDEVLRTWDMTTGLTSTILGNQLIAMVEALGLNGGDYGREKFVDDGPSGVCSGICCKISCRIDQCSSYLQRVSRNPQG